MQLLGLAFRPSSCHRVSHQPLFPGPFLSLSLAVSSSTESHPASQRHVQAKGQRQEQDRKQAALFRLCRPGHSTFSSLVNGRGRRFSRHLYTTFLPRKSLIKHLVKRIKCYRYFYFFRVELWQKKRSLGPIFPTIAFQKEMFSGEFMIAGYRLHTYCLVSYPALEYSIVLKKFFLFFSRTLDGKPA